MWNCFETEILLRTCKHKFEKWKFQQSGTFFVWVHIFYFLWNIPLSWNHWEINFMLFGLNVSLLDKKNHTCLEKITHVWNLPLNKTSLMWLGKATHVWEKPLSICIFMKWQKPHMCGFYQTRTKYKGVWKKPHMFVKNLTCVYFSI